MKHHSFLPLLCGIVLALGLGSCSQDVTPTTDTTSLWPAYQAANQKYGYINAAGEWVIQPQYDAAATFSCGYAKVYLNGKNYYINTKGDLQQVTFDSVDDFYYGYAVVSLSGNYGMINNGLTYAIPAVYAHLGQMSKEGLASFRRSKSDRTFGYIDKSGTEVIQPVYEWAGDFEDGIACIMQGGKMGAINTSGKMVIMPLYDQLTSIGNGCVLYSESNKYGLMSTNGTQLTSPLFRAVGQFLNNGLAPYCLSGSKYGYINRDGKEQIPSNYDLAQPFSEGYAWVMINDQYQLIDTKGQIVCYLSEGWHPVSLCHNGLLLVIGEDAEYRYITPQGTPVFSWKGGSNLSMPSSSTITTNYRASRHFMLGQ